jgi:hypothetical protein
LATGFGSAAWSPTVTGLLQNLRDALSALAPIAARAHISWREGEAYDDSDDLATRIYEVLVSRPIAGDASGGSGVLPLAPYDMRLQHFAENSSLVVPGLDGTALFFNKLLPGEGDFAAAEALPATLDGRLLDSQPEALPMPSASWMLLRRRSDGSSDLVERITLEP